LIRASTGDRQLVSRAVGTNHPQPKSSNRHLPRSSMTQFIEEAVVAAAAWRRVQHAPVVLVSLHLSSGGSGQRSLARTDRPVRQH